MSVTALQSRVTNLILQVEKMRPKSIAGLIFFKWHPIGWVGAWNCWKANTKQWIPGHTASWWQWGEEIQSWLSVFHANHQMTLKKHFWGWKVLYNYCFQYKYFPLKVKLFFFITTDFIKPMWLSLFKLLQCGLLKPCETSRVSMQNLCSWNALPTVLNHPLRKTLSLQFP